MQIDEGQTSAMRPAVWAWVQAALAALEQTQTQAAALGPGRYAVWDAVRDHVWAQVKDFMARTASDVAALGGEQSPRDSAGFDIMFQALDDSKRVEGTAEGRASMRLEEWIYRERYSQGQKCAQLVVYFSPWAPLVGVWVYGVPPLELLELLEREFARDGLVRLLPNELVILEELRLEMDVFW